MPVGDAIVRTSLSSIYGHSKRHLEGQSARYSDAISTFTKLAGAGPVVVFRAPGRVNLIGEHTDYNQGYVLPMALDKDTVLVARRRSDAVVRLWNIESQTFGERSFDISSAIAPWPLGDWGNYIKAAAQALFVHNHNQLCGMDALIVGAAPWGTPRAAGLSSSSALLVAAAMVLASLNQIEVEKVSFARMCSEAEWYVGTRGGIMDHFISILARRGHALLLDCRPQTDVKSGHLHYTMEHVSIPDGYRVLICNSGVERQKTRSKYNVRVAECRLAVTMLMSDYPHITHLRDVSVAGLSICHNDVMALVNSLPESVAMSDVQRQPALAAALQTVNSQFAADEVFLVRARARHVVSENARVLEAVQALRLGDAPAVGRLMNEAHESMSIDYGASCPEVDALAGIARRTSGVLGARVTGAGWGGCVVALAQDADLGVERSVAEEYRAATGLSTNIFVCRSAPGAGEVGGLL
jgi:galactokinase